MLTYFVAHEGHHRGQLVMAARQLGHRLPQDIGGRFHVLMRFNQKNPPYSGRVRWQSASQGAHPETER